MAIRTPSRPHPAVGAGVDASRREADAAVRPDLPGLIALRRLAERSVAARRGAGSQSPMAQSVLRGRGMDYAETRPYSPGDDVRHVDWRVTARTGRLHSKTFHAERERVSLILADTAPALYFGTRVRLKSVQAARVAALATWFAVRAGDRPGALRATHSEPPCRPRGGVRGALPVLAALARWYEAPPSEDLGLAEGLRAARRLLHPGASLLVVADPGSFEPVEDALLAALAGHCQVRVVLLYDRFELQPPRAALRFLGGARTMNLDLGAESIRRQWQARFGERLAATEQRLQRLGAGAWSVAGDASAEDLARLLSGRGGGAFGGRS